LLAFSLIDVAGETPALRPKRLPLAAQCPHHERGAENEQYLRSGFLEQSTGSKDWQRLRFLSAVLCVSVPLLVRWTLRNIEVLFHHRDSKTQSDHFGCGFAALGSLRLAQTSNHFGNTY
jgi:hypothetical protein